MAYHDKLSTDTLTYLQRHIRNVPDFPIPGILFKDITPLLADPRAFHMALDFLAHEFIGKDIDAVIGIESRGFIFGGALAARLNASFVPVRKAGKLPYKTESITYALEYGTATLQIHSDALTENQRVLIVDDLLATGGTAVATAKLAKQYMAQVVGFAFAVELDFLHGREKLASIAPSSTIWSLLHYSAGQ